jgi:hypothetical protein
MWLAGDIVTAHSEASHAWRLACDLQERWEAVGTAQPAARDDPRLQGITFFQLQGELRLLSWLTCVARGGFPPIALLLVPYLVDRQHIQTLSHLRAGPVCSTLLQLASQALLRITAGLRLASLLQTGRLMEQSSSPEEALWCFQEACGLVCEQGHAHSRIK